MRIQRGFLRVLGIAVCVVASHSSGPVVRAADAEADEGSIRPGGRPERRPDLTPAQVDEVMTFVEAHFPIAYNVLSRVEERNPRAFRRRIQQIAPRIFEMKRAIQEDPPIGRLLVADFRLESQIIELQHEYRQTPDAFKKRGLAAELRLRITEQFDVQVRRQRLTLDRLEERLDAQRQRLDNQADRREQIILERFQDAMHGPLDQRPGGPNDAESGDE